MAKWIGSERLHQFHRVKRTAGETQDVCLTSLRVEEVNRPCVKGRDNTACLYASYNHRYRERAMNTGRIETGPSS